MLSNTDISIYNYHKDKETGVESYNRTFIGGVFWADSKQSNVLKSGIANADSVYIHVPKSSFSGRYLSSAEYKAKTAEQAKEFFTLDANSKDLIVKGKQVFEFDYSSPKAIAESKKTLIEEYNAVTVNMVDEALYGSEFMQHIEYHVSR